MGRVLLIVNPFASRVTDDGVDDVARELGRAAHLDVVTTTRRGHATELARDADTDAVVVYSGDGGFNEVLNGLPARLPVGFVPGGGTSVLPRALGLPRDARAAAARVAGALGSARTRTISVGRANGRRFGFSAGVGLDAELVRRVDALGRSRAGRRAGDVAFVLVALRLLAEERFALDPALEVREAGRAPFALVANCDSYSYVGRLPLRVAPLARFELGLDVVAPARVTPFAIPRFLGYALLGRAHRARDVHYVHDADAVSITCDRPLPLQADGEDLGDVEELEVIAERGAVEVLV